MPLKKLLFFIFSSNNLPLYQDEATGHILEGNENYLKSNGQPAHLQHSPDAWGKVEAKYGRNTKYWGLFRSLTLPLKYVEDGAAILRSIMWSGGLNSISSIGLMKFDPVSLPYRYTSWLLLENNFAKYKESKTGVEIEALEGGVGKFFKANESTVYELDIDNDPEVINVLMDGLELDCKFNFSSFVDFAPTGSHLVPITFLNGEGTQLSMGHGDLIISIGVSGGYQSTSQDWFLKAFATTEIRVRGNLRIVPFTDTGAYALILRTSTNRTHTLYSNPTVNTTTLTFSFDETFTINENENVFLEASWSGSLDLPYGESQFTVEFVNRYPATIIKALYPFRVFQLLVDKMTNGQYTVASDWLNSRKDIAITSGDAIRSLPGAKIKTSIADFFKSMNRWSIGLAVKDDKLIIEPLSFFFQDEVITDIGEVKGAEITVAEDICFNTISAGYEKQDYEDVNGRFEFNQGQKWITPITKIIKELDLVSPYRADPYGIEFTRINFAGKTTTDSGSDNDTFMLNIETALTTVDPDSYYKLFRPAYSAISGIPHPDSIFNTELTPKKSIIANSAFIHSILELLEAQKNTFVSDDKNAELSTTLDGVTVTENEDIQIGSLPSKLFRPYYFNFSTQVPINLFEILNTNPYGKIQFTWNDQQWYGFLMDGGIRPATNDSQSWKLLCAPENDLSKFNT